jgi:hypothetical protein
MAELTYNPNEPQEGEFNEEEQEALKVGEALEEQQQQLLAGKFKDAEDLEKAYIELQGKLGKPDKEEETTTTEDSPPEEETDEQRDPVDYSLLNKLWEEAQNEITPETVKELEQLDVKDVAKQYLQYRYESEQNAQAAEPTMTEEDVGKLKATVGGEKRYGEMMTWAQQTLQPKEIEMFDKVMSKGDALASYFAIQALAYRYQETNGVEGQMLSGKPASNSKDVFRSQAQVVKAMQDPRYDKDPAYRQDIYNKLERSDLEF